jgi:hypothetical protein
MDGLAAADGYENDHPGSVVMLAELRPSATQVLAYVLTTRDPASIIAALRPTYGARLCVTRSHFTRAQIDAACAPLQALERTFTSGIFASGCNDLGTNAQPVDEFDLMFVDQRIASLAAAQPPGLIKLEPFVVPSH